MALPVPANPTLERLLDRESARNEYRVGLVRVFAYSLVTLIDVAMLASGVRSTANLLVSVPFVALSVAILWVTRRRFIRLIRYVVPLIDAGFIFAILTLRIEMAGGLTLSNVAGTAAACALFAATGGIRIHFKSALWTTALAMAAFLGLIAGRGELLLSVYPLAGIAGVGMLAIWLSDLSRRALMGEQGRLVLKRFVHDGVVDQAFDDPNALVAGQPRTVEATVLMSDLRGFTTISESLQPAELLAMLNELQGALAEAVRRRGGVVDKFMGDGMLATFGAITEQPDHVDQALGCALDIVAAVEEINRRHPGRLPLRIGIGLHTGELVVGNVGAGDRLERTVIGDTVNTAARLESHTKDMGGPIAVSEVTAHRAKLSLEPRGSVQLRGKSMPMQVFAPAAEAWKAAG